MNTDGASVPLEDISVALPKGQYDGKLNFSNWSHNLTLKWPSTGDQTDIPGTLSSDGKTISFPQVDLKLNHKDDRILMWLPVHAHEDAPAGEAILQFTIGGQGSFPASLEIIGASSIATIAGNGTAGFSGDNQPAINAELNLPYRIATDSRNNVYIADYGNNRVRMVSAASGVITTVAGNGTAGFSG
ncbi:hypothetical protein ACFWX8_32575, partial [Streptomyces violascens]